MKHTRVKLTVFTLAVAIILAMVLTACGSEAGTQTNAPVSSSTSDSTLPQVLQTSTAEQLNYRKK